MTDNRRYVFLSATFLSKQYKAIPTEVIDNSIFLFGSKRSWLFPSSREEMLEARGQTTKYLEFDEDYKSLIRQKEKQKLVFWLLPERSYGEASKLLEDTTDPTSGEHYLPLILDESWWISEFVPADAKYTGDVKTIIGNFKQGEFDYDAVMELLYQSNPTLVPTLYWAEN